MLTNFLFFMSMNGFLLLPIHVQQMGGDEAHVGLVQATYSIAGILFQPLVGVWVNRLGRRFFMRLGAALLLLSAVGFLASSSITLHAALRGVQGLAFSAFFVSSYIHIVDVVPVERRGWALGIFGLSGLTSTALAPLLGEAVVRHMGFRWSFALSALLAAGTLVLVLRTKGIRPPAPGGGPGPEALREGLQELLRVHMGLGFFFGLGTGAVFTFLPTFAESLGVTGLGLFYTAYSASAVAVRLFGGDLIDTRGRRAVILPSMIVFTAAVCMLALLASTGLHVAVLPFLFLSGLISGAAHGFLYPALSALLVDVTAESRRASAVGIFSAACLVGNAVGAVAFGYVAHGLGYSPMWTMLAIFMGGGIALSYRLAPGPGAARAGDSRPRVRGAAARAGSVDLHSGRADTAEALRPLASAEGAHEHPEPNGGAGTTARL